jgi:hypothetical protein
VILPSLLASGIMAAVVQSLLSFVLVSGGIPALVVAIACGAALYGLLIWCLDRKAVDVLWAVALGMVKRKDALSEV